MKIIGFYHICMVNNWQEIVKDQIKRTINSGLYNKSEIIYIGCLGTLSNFRLLKSQLPSKYKIAFHSNKIKLFEIPTLNLIKKMADRDNFYAWYIHTKGVTSVEKVGPRIKESRKFLEHFIIDRHADCIKSLTNYDCCGIGWQCSEISRLASCKNYCYFCGNFWWTKSEFIKKLHYI
ncbi:MAG: hypothetical protein GTO02_11820, partial [Candidatus Dadabacteria bacterium]|nr:hypothetical protein [Candidatus Dadabacteria bacterium]